MKCSVEDCQNEATRKGMCQKHYMRIYKNGNLEKKVRELNEIEHCSIEGCNNKHYAKGLCNTHYVAEKRKNNSKKDKKTPGRKPFLERNKEILKLKSEGKSSEEIAKIFRITRQRVNQIYNRSINKN